MHQKRADFKRKIGPFFVGQYTVIHRSRKGTGFDYWLGDEKNEDELPLQSKARLEVSGIRRADAKESELNKAPCLGLGKFAPSSLAFPLFFAGAAAVGEGSDAEEDAACHEHGEDGFAGEDGEFVGALQGVPIDALGGPVDGVGACGQRIKGHD